MTVRDSIRRLFGRQPDESYDTEAERLDTMNAAQEAQATRIDAKIAAQEHDKRV